MRLAMVPDIDPISPEARRAGRVTGFTPGSSHTRSAVLDLHQPPFSPDYLTASNATLGASTSRSQTRTTPSSPPAATQWPSADTATA